MSNSSIWPIDRTLSGATTLGQSGPGSDGNEGILCLSLGFIITEASQSDDLVSYLEHSLMYMWRGRRKTPIHPHTMAVRM